MNNHQKNAKVQAKIVLEGIKVVEEFHSPDSHSKTLEDFCQEKRISPETFEQWRKEFVRNAKRAFEPRWYFYLPRFLGIALFLIVVVYLAAIPLGWIAEANRLETPEVILIAVLLILLFNVIERVAEINVGPEGVSARFRNIENRQETLQSEVDTMRIVLEGIVTKWELDKLKGLAKDDPFMVRYRSSLYGELKHLDAMGYIRPQEGRGLRDIRNQYERNRHEKFDLKDYVRITDEGKEYLELRGALPEG